jgi:hypothetical protein
VKCKREEKEDNFTPTLGQVLKKLLHSEGATKWEIAPDDAAECVVRLLSTG